MARKKKDTAIVTEDNIQTIWPQIDVGNHSTFIRHENGDFEHIIDWDKLAAEINTVLTEYENSSNIVKPKRSKKKNES